AVAGSLDLMTPDQRQRLISAMESGNGLRSMGDLQQSRNQELEADHIGVFLMTFAGYDPHQAVVFWERMKEISDERGGRPPEILSDHPSDAHRIQAMKEWVPKALAAKQAYDEGRIAPEAR